jgi:hypothetical protein
MTCDKMICYCTWQLMVTIKMVVVRPVGSICLLLVAQPDEQAHIETRISIRHVRASSVMCTFQCAGLSPSPPPAGRWSAPWPMWAPS